MLELHQRYPLLSGSTKHLCQRFTFRLRVPLLCFETFRAMKIVYITSLRYSNWLICRIYFVQPNEQCYQVHDSHLLECRLQSMYSGRDLHRPARGMAKVNASGKVRICHDAYHGDKRSNEEQKSGRKANPFRWAVTHGCSRELYGEPRLRWGTRAINRAPPRGFVRVHNR